MLLLMQKINLVYHSTISPLLTSEIHTHKQSSLTDKHSTLLLANEHVLLTN